MLKVGTSAFEFGEDTITLYGDILIVGYPTLEGLYPWVRSVADIISVEKQLRELERCAVVRALPALPALQRSLSVPSSLVEQLTDVCNSSPRDLMSFFWTPWAPSHIDT